MTMMNSPRAQGLTIAHNILNYIYGEKIDILCC